MCEEITYSEKDESYINSGYFVTHLIGNVGLKAKVKENSKAMDNYSKILFRNKDTTDALYICFEYHTTYIKIFSYICINNMVDLLQ